MIKMAGDGGEDAFFPTWLLGHDLSATSSSHCFELSSWDFRSKLLTVVLVSFFLSLKRLILTLVNVCD